MFLFPFFLPVTLLHLLHCKKSPKEGKCCMYNLAIVFILWLFFFLPVKSFVTFWAIKYLSQQGLTKFRTKHRATLQTQRQLIQASRLLARARTTTKKSQSQSLAKTALAEADNVISISPDDAAGHIVRALALDLLGHHTSALKSFDMALTYPRLKSLSVGERADALVKRAEMKLAVNRRRRIDSAIEDLEESVKLAAGTDTARIFRLLGECYEFKGLKEKAHWALNEALKVQPSSATARDG